MTPSPKNDGSPCPNGCHPWGRINHGQSYNIMTTDLARALFRAGLNAYELSIVQQVWEFTWGESARSKEGRGNRWPETRGYALNVSQLARETGENRTALARAKTSLIASRILEAQGREVRINKNVDEWIYPDSGEPRLTAKAVEFASKAHPKTQAELPLKGSDRSTGPVADQQQSRPKTVADQQQGVLRISNRKCCASATGGVAHQQQLPIEEHPRGIRLSEEREGESPPPPSAPLRGAEEGSRAEFDPAARAELEEVARLCREWFPGRPEIELAIARRQGGYPIAWYRAAAERLCTHPSERHNRQYLLGILKNYRGDGGPPASRKSRAPSPSPLPTFRPSPEQLAAREARSAIRGDKP